LRELKNIWKLINTGTVEKEDRKPLKTLIFSGKVLLILFAFKIISIGLIFFLDWLEVFEMPINLNRDKLSSFSEIEILLLTSVYAPILEEIAFRLPLRFSKLNFSLGLLGISLIFCRVLGEFEYVYSLISSVTIGIITYFILNDKIGEGMAKFWRKYRLLILYTSLSVFSLLHLKNYKLTTELLLFSPIFILPRILGGLIFSYVRLSSGIFLAILIHSFNNGFLKLLALLG